MSEARPTAGAVWIATFLVTLGCSEGSADEPSQSGGGQAGATRSGSQAGAAGTAGGTGAAGSRGEAYEGPAFPLHVEGRHLRGPQGQTVVLRGVNQHGFLDVPDGAWDAPGEPLYSGMGQWRSEVVQGTLDEYRRLGFNVVRLHTVVDWWKTNPQSYRDSYRDVTYPKPYREMMEDVIRWAAERGLYVIFDFFAMLNTDGVQSGQESLPWPPWGRYPEVVADRGEFVDIWDSVAEVLGGNTNVLFELYNEPHGDASAEAEWFDFVREVLPVIRARTDNPVVVQWDYMCWVNLDYPPPQYSASTLEWIERHPLPDTNVVFSTHLYRNSGAGGPGMPHRSETSLINLWERDDLEEALTLVLLPKALNDWAVPVVVPEIGAYLSGDSTDQAREIEWLSNMLALLGELGVGYVGWAWRSDEQLDHGMLHDGVPNEAGQAFLAAVGQP